jgi:hypothetical protein
VASVLNDFLSLLISRVDFCDRQIHPTHLHPNGKHAIEPDRELSSPKLNHPVNGLLSAYPCCKTFLTEQQISQILGLMLMLTQKKLKQRSLETRKIEAISTIDWASLTAVDKAAVLEFLLTSLTNGSLGIKKNSY